MGCRRDRSRSGDARPAGNDADSASRRLSAGGRAARRRDGDRSCADRRRDAARKGVVGKFVEFFGSGLSALPVVDRTTIATCRRSSVRRLQSSRSTTARSSICVSPAARSEQIDLVEAYAKAQGLFRTDASARSRVQPIRFRSTSAASNRVLPGRAGRRIASRYATSSATSGRRAKEWIASRERNGAIARFEDEGGGGTATIAQTAMDIYDGAVVIAAITSCTNTSNPSVLDRRRPAGAKRRRTRPLDAAVGEDVARARLESGHRLSRRKPDCASTSTGSASISSATAVRPASGTRAPCRPTLRRPSPIAT